MKDRVCIISVVYGEPEWKKTKECLELLDIPVNYIDRGGVGSLAEAINKGFTKYAKPKHDYVLFVTNVTFPSMMLKKLVKEMDRSGYAAIHPSFNSDHHFCRPLNQDCTVESPFVEFTCCMVRRDVFLNHYLDERMPYWGHDLDWGYRVKRSGYDVGIYHGIKLEHVYIRHNKKKHPLTQERKRLRNNADSSTKAALIDKYGPNWRDFVWAL